jgi:outer membrane protein insertion porin family
LDNYNSNWFTFSNGNSNTISFGVTFSRQTLDQPIYPRSGSMFSIGLQITPPYSAFKAKNFWIIPLSQSVNLDSAQIFNQEQSNKYQFIEFHKWTYRGIWVNELAKNLVLYFNSQFGYLGYFSRNLGYSPFEGYVLGGSGMTWNALGGREIVGLRGYQDQSVTPPSRVEYYVNNQKTYRSSTMANLYEKMTFELRYPISLQPSATIYVEAFLEAGNSWLRYEDFNPFILKRSAGIGLRAFLPMVGAIGVDWGYGFDPIPWNPAANRGQFHFTMGQTF